MIRFDNHAPKGLDDALRELFQQLEAMSGHLGELSEMLPRALDMADPCSFEEAKAIDKLVDEAEHQTEQIVTRIINKFAIGAEELRFILGSIKIAGHLERAADRLKNCLKRLSRRQGPLADAVKAHLLTAITAIKAMVPLVMAQILEYDAGRTEALLSHGAAVQKSYRQILLHLHQHRPAQVGDDQHILLVAKNLEQTADMQIEIMKICHYIHFATKYEKGKEAAS